MLVLGLDIGTTTVSAVVADGSGVLAAKTLKHDALIPARPVWERLHDPQKLTAAAHSALRELLAAYPGVQRIGVTGQQHGIVYLDAAGTAVSPLYTWQDERGNLPFDAEQSYAERLHRLSGMPVASGYGMLTHFYNLKNGLVPAAARSFCTIADLLAMQLSGSAQPRLDASNAAALGLFDLERGRFDPEAIHAAGIEPGSLPALAKQPCLGSGALGIPVFTAIGDNQASFLGATGGASGAMLVNIGTGSQFSVHTPRLTHCEGLETRPFPTGGYLLVGSSLCGGRAYALLEQFFRKTAQLVTGEPQRVCYDAMARALEAQPEPADCPTFVPLFQGTRDDPSLRATLTGLSAENFDPLCLLHALLRGMAEELRAMCASYLRAGGSMGALYGSGNALRKNPRLCALLAQSFSQSLILSQNEEEAAFGAALYAGRCPI